LDPFEALKKEVLPQLIEKRQLERGLVIWSAACSSGQEAVSLAILIKENFPLLENWSIKIIGTDICTAVLEKARVGEFTQVEVNRGLPAGYLVKHFTKEGLNWRVKDHIRKMMEFREFNLISNDWYKLPRFDLVLLRNVLIYFTIDTKREILGNVRKVLAPDGCLFLGAAETTLGIDPGYNRAVHGKTSYYRPISA
jgi:chemotaxis protein methyltransferase CheR